ncbi:hypothetical protein HPB50_008165 [Hyalomma asiaticum]|uniref:Uncharacterized protein n=1 Tax=Hyalomma asiaticum TaxID=266040 RepID=A0ACB7T8K2_HYAAI|nr:hypothetical protein HPB50_008165 [Hyalomma asiaticum]
MVLLIEAGGMEDAFSQVPLFTPLLIAFDWKYLPEPQKNACLSMDDQLLHLLFDELYRGSEGERPVVYASTHTRLSEAFLQACKENGYPIIDYNGRSQAEQMEQGHRNRRRRSESRRPPYTDHSHPPSASPQPQTRASTPHERFDSTEHPRRRLPATTPPRHPVPAQPTSVNQSPSQPTTAAPGRSHRDVATWSHEGVDSPAAYVSSRPWRRQKGAIVETPLSRLFRLFQGRTVTAADNRAQTACLAVPAGTRFCECGAMIIHPSHERGALHKRSTHKAQAPSHAGSEEPRPNEAARVMMERAAQDQGFANWLLQVATNNQSGGAHEWATRTAGLPPPDATTAATAPAATTASATMQSIMKLRSYAFTRGVEKKHFMWRIKSGGSAGCVLANRLSADPSNMVLLIKAGVMVDALGQVPLFAPLLIWSRFGWNHLPEPQKNACLSMEHQKTALSKSDNISTCNEWIEFVNGLGVCRELKIIHHTISLFSHSELCRSAEGEIPVVYASTHTRLSEGFLEACKENGYPIIDYNGRSQAGEIALSQSVRRRTSNVMLL